MSCREVDDSLFVKNAVHHGGEYSGLAREGRLLEFLEVLFSTQATRTVTGSKRNGFVKEEELGHFPRYHKRKLLAAEIRDATDPPGALEERLA